MENSNTTFISPEDLVAQLRVLRAQIPDYGQLTARDTYRLAGAARAFTPPMTAAAVSATGASTRIASAIGFTPEQLQAAESEATRWTVAEQELAAMLQGVAKANLIRRHRAGSALLQAYALGRKLVRQPEHADLLPHVAEMTRAVRMSNGGRPKRPSTSPPAPAPAPEPSHQGTSTMTMAN